MTYFSYNDYADYDENGKIEEISKLRENIEKYEQINGKYKEQDFAERIISILKNKVELRKFLKEFFSLDQIENIIYCNIMKKKLNKNNIISKIKQKEIYVFIKVIENIDNNITYKMFEDSLNIISRWNKEEKAINKRYPIVIPIVIYIGKEIWKQGNNKVYSKIKYITYKDNKINFSFNIIKIQDLEFNELVKMKSKVAEEMINIKNKYLH